LSRKKKKTNGTKKARQKRFGQYKLLKKLATGGMAEIFLARHINQPESKPDVALKRILKHHSENTQLVKMFFREASIITRLNHENIIRILDFGKENENFYMTMDHVKGVNLDTIFNTAHKNQEKWNLKYGIEIVRQALEGIKHAHNLKDDKGNDVNIVHLDLSPRNLMVSGRGLVKILDFGISKATYDDDKKSFNALRGTYAYMSPEQCKEKPVDKRSDLFSLGILLYEMTTLAPLFSKQPSEFMILRAITEGIVPPPSNIIQNYPPELEQIIYQALEVDPNKRFQSAEAFLKALESVSKNYNMSLDKLELSKGLSKVLPELVVDQSSLPSREELTFTDDEKSGDSEKKESDTKSDRQKSEIKVAEQDSEKAQEKQKEIPNFFKDGTNGDSKKSEKAEDSKEDVEEDLPAPQILTLADQAEELMRHKQKSRILYTIFTFLFMALVSAGVFMHYQKTGWLPETVGSTIYVPDSGTLYIDTKPEGAKIFIDNKLQTGKTPFEMQNLPLNKKIPIEIVMSGYATIKESVVLDNKTPLKAMVHDLVRQ